MKVVVAGDIAFRSVDCPPKLLERLGRELSFPNPEYVSRKRMRRYFGATPERIECMEVVDDCVHIPRAAVDVLRQFATDIPLELRFDDHRVTHEPIAVQSSIELRQYQADAVKALRRGVQGTLLMPCGGGKTVVGISLVDELRQPTLVLVHTNDLLSQWQEAAGALLGIEVGEIGDGESIIRPVTIATVQSLVRMDDASLEELGSRFGCVLIDEAHHTPASTFRRILGHLAGRYRYGLTATPERADGLTRLLDLVVGPRLYGIGLAELTALGHLECTSIQPICSAFTFDYSDSNDYANCMAALVANEERNSLIVDIVVGDVRRHASTVLVLSARVEHCRRLTRMIRAAGIDAEIFVGSVSKKERESILARFREGKLAVVVASTVADEGLDVPRLNRVVLAYPTRAGGRLTQRIGRLMRLFPGKGTPIFYDIVDKWVSPLARQSAERKRAYRKLAGVTLLDEVKGGTDDSICAS